jgi:flagellar biosynthesis protein FlhG
MQNDSKLITIASGKGGVGKTWFSVTLTHALSQLGKKTLLFDGDLGLANVDIQLGQVPERDLGDVIAGNAVMSDVITCYDKNTGSFDYIPGKSGSGALGALSRDMLRSIRGGLVTLSDAYDHVLLDMAAGIDPAVTTLCNHTGRILVVMTADPTSLTDAYAFIKVTVTKNPKANISIVVNNAANKREGERTYESIKRACEGFLKISPPLQGIIRADAKVVDAIRSQIPLIARHPQSEAAADVKAIAASLS